MMWKKPMLHNHSRKKNDYVLGPFMITVQKRKKKLKDFLELLFTNNIYMKQI
jgi:hypothetical protein